MKILQVFDIFSRYQSGTTEIAYHLSRVLAEKGHEVEVYTSSYKADPESARVLQRVKIHFFRTWVRIYGFIVTPGLILKARRQVKDFDVIHLHCLRSFANIVLHHYAQKHKVPYVLDSHGSVSTRLARERGKILLQKVYDFFVGNSILNDAALLITETHIGADEYRKAGVRDEAKIVVYPLPMPVEEFSQLPPPGFFKRKYNINEKHVILSFGRINWIKGIDFLVSSFYRLAQSRRDVILVIAGPDDGVQSDLQKLVKKLNLPDRVLFTGYLAGEDRLAALADASVMVQPSRFEQAAWAPLEAVLCGTPIIVSRHTGAGEDVRRIDAGYLVKFGDEDEMVDTIERILDNPSEAKYKTQKASDYIKEHLSMAKLVSNYEQIYISVLENK